MKFEIGTVTQMGTDTFTLLELPSKENGGRMKYEVTMAPTPKDLIMPLHSHPDMTETTEMLEGQMSIFTGGRQLLVGPGESYSSPPGTPHMGRNPNDTPSRFYWICDPEPSLVPTFEKVVREYWEGCAACATLGHFAIMRLEQYLYEGIKDEDYITGEPISAEKALSEVGSFIDRSGGLKAVCDSAPVLLKVTPHLAGISPEPVRTKLFELFAAIASHPKVF